MNFEKIKSDGMKHEYRVVFSPDDVEQHVVNAVKEKARTFRMQGFRPGHVPMSIVRKSVEPQIIKDVLEDLVNKACQSIANEIGATELATRPTYRFENTYQNGQEVKVLVNIEAAPHFELKSFKMTLKKVVPVIKDEEISKVKEDLVQNMPIYDEAEDDHVIQSFDKVFYNVKTIVSGIPAKKGVYDNVTIVPDNPADKFHKLLIGKKKGDSFEYSNDDKKNTTYKVTIKSINKWLKDLPHENFTKRVGFESVEEFDKAARSVIEKELAELAFTYHKHQVLDYLSAEYNFDLPHGVVEQETKTVISSIRRELEKEKMDGTADPEDLKKTNEDFAEEYAEVIKKRVLLGYILNKFAKQHSIAATDDELRNAIIKEAQSDPLNSDKIITFYTGNHHALAYKRAEIIEQKVIQFLISQCEAVEEQLTKKEIENLIDKLLEE